jgi:hypothetical protein
MYVCVNVCGHEEEFCRPHTHTSVPYSIPHGEVQCTLAHPEQTQQEIDLVGEKKRPLVGWPERRQYDRWLQVHEESTSEVSVRKSQSRRGCNLPVMHNGADCSRQEDLCLWCVRSALLLAL